MASKLTVAKTDRRKVCVFVLVTHAALSVLDEASDDVSSVRRQRVGLLGGGGGGVMFTDRAAVARLCQQQLALKTC